jgi:hypothetical protein
MPIVGALSQVVSIVDKQTYLGQNVFNVYWYLMTSLANANASALSATFKTTVQEPLVLIQNNTLIHQSNLVTNWTDPAVFGEFATVFGGARVSTDVCASWIACGMRLNRASRDMRNGQKRYSGLNEADLTGNTLSAPFLALATTFAPALLQSLVIGAQTWTPVIIRHNPTLADPAIDPLVTATWRYALLSGISISGNVRHQDSREP